MIQTNNSITENNTDLQVDDHFISILGGHIFFQTLATGAKLGLFTLLDNLGALTKEQIQHQLELKERPARILLHGLVSLNLISQTDDLYENTPMANKFLSKNSPVNYLAIIDWQADINYHALGHYYESTITGDNEGLIEFEGNENNLYQRLSHSPSLEKTFQDAMHSISVQANQDLVNGVDFSDRKKIVDIGGGDGSNIMKITENYENLQGLVFDSKSVCEIAKKNIKQHNRQEACDVYQGNCFETPFPTDADAFIFCHFLTIWSEEKNKFLLKKAYDALPKGGKVYIFNMMQNDNENGPLTSAMGSPYFLTLATSEGMLYTWKEYITWLKEAGFGLSDVKRLPLDHGVIIGIKN